MEENSPRIRSLLRQAANVAESGKRAAALKLYRQIVAEAPEAVEGWLGLADQLRSDSEKRSALERALALDPGNAEAQEGLALLDGESPAPNEPEVVDTANFDSARSWLDEQTARQRFDILDGPGERQPAQAEPEPPAVTPAPDIDVTDHLPVRDESEALFCYRHPQRETNLRCISCNKPICGQCAQHTPVGYRCPTCIREAQDVFYSATPLDYLLVALVSLPLSLLAGFVVSNFAGGFFFIILIFFVGGAIGRFIGRVAHRVAGRRRGRYLPYVVAGAIVVGALLPVLDFLIFILFGNFGAIGALLVPGIYIFVAASAAFYSMR